MSGLLFGVRPADPVTIAAVTLTLAGVALLAAWVPAWRASRVDRSEHCGTDSGGTGSAPLQRRVQPHG